MDTILTIIGMTATFLVGFAAFVWWIASQFFGVKNLVKGLQNEILKTIGDLHAQNVERFHNVETRLTKLESFRRIPRGGE